MKTSKSTHRDFYGILGVKSDATILEIEAAWQKKQRFYELNQPQELEDERQALEKAERELANAAYETLKEPAKRREYDRALAHHATEQAKQVGIPQLERTMNKKAERTNDRAITYWKQSRFDDAIALWEEVVLETPNIAEIHHNLGNAYAHQGKIENAIESLKQAIAIDPTLIEAYNKLGCIYYKQGNLDLAFASWNFALKIDPNSEEALHNIRLIQNATQFDVENEIPAYQQIAPEEIKQERPRQTGEDDGDRSTWKDRIRQRLKKFRKE